MVTTHPFPRLLAASIDGRCHNTRYRQSQLQCLQSALVHHVEELKKSIQSDSGHSAGEVSAEICLALQELRTHYLSLDLQRDLEAEYRVANGRDNLDGKRGVGIVYIAPCTHTLFFSVVSALSAAVAAGNCVILEVCIQLSQTTMTLPTLLRKILTTSLDADTFAISEERPDASFLTLPQVLPILQTESSNTAQYLSASPTARTIAVVDRTANIASATEQLVAARFAFGGHSPYSPDVVLVNEFVMKEFIEAVIQQSGRYLAPETAARNPRGRPAGASVLDLAFKEKGARVVVSGSGWGVVDVLDRESALLQKMNEKVLLVHSVTSLDDAIDFGNSMTPLAATYAFAAPSSAKYLTQFIDAHISWINHVPTDMLIGPQIPTNTPFPSQTRYSTDLLQLPRPQIAQETRKAAIVRAALSSSPESATVWNAALAPLPGTGQRAGRKIGFFEQGIITGGVITLFSVVVSLGTLGYYALGVVRRVR
ncbi:ALDH-like protein [Aspergillus steynii IBT 23096]|uniref:ALDH-like protein n=1 Tax=Aspergillus steynii IBT 23096 TaxID=1392250 RepID=A0A2I2G002_9EURO|nr:ALDH-like protein [Aspergillus steynii IBT 23096]PLB46156.1 ALDH-like protein [Aspergillus steynii IBT 23096]